jgi:PAS domain-containing protein
MAAKRTSAHQPPDLLSLCLAITEHAPLPMVTVEGASHIVRYANPAFCRLLDKPSEQLVGMPFCENAAGKGRMRDVARPGFSHGKTRKPHGTRTFKTSPCLLVFYDVAGVGG